MKRITILTLFPEMFDNFKKFSIIKRAIENKKIKINVVNFRDFSKDKHKKVDDYQFGGGAGMIIAIPTIARAIKKYRGKNTTVILTSPQGKTYNQKIAKSFADSKKNLLIVCGHYEGFDARIINYVDQIISIGDFVLTGGEIPAMAIVESVTRLIKGVITSSSLDSESFSDNLLDYDTYTRPVEYDGYKVPEVLLSGNHKKIDDWRKQNRLAKTKKFRPDLLK